jgi:hypothetical protein
MIAALGARARPRSASVPVDEQHLVPSSALKYMLGPAAASQSGWAPPGAALM